MAGISRANRALAGLCLLTAAIGLWNVLHCPPGASYDYQDNAPYADGLIPGLHLPAGGLHPAAGDGSYYTPPGFYAVAGTADWIARGLGLGEPHRAGMAVDVLFLVGSVLLVALIARQLWPGRERIALGAAAFVAFLPSAVQAGAMFHPEMMSFFFSALALWLCARTFADARWAWALGLALGIDQLVRAYALCTVGAVLLALLWARRWRALAIAAVVAAAIPMPWYVHETVKYGSPLFPRPAISQTTNERATTVSPLYRRRPARFYVDPALPDVLTHPYRPRFEGLLLPTTYAGLWGDYEGHWAWDGTTRDKVVPTPSASTRHALVLQMFLGLLPTLLAFGGWILLLAQARRELRKIAVAVLPVAVAAAYVYFTVSNGSATNPAVAAAVLKPSYMLTATTGWALGFGLALDRLPRRTFLVAAGVLAVCAAVELPFLLY